MTRPPRTLGISLAIIAGAFLFSCLPLTQTAILFVVSARQNPEILPSGQDGQSLPTIVGADVFELNRPGLIVQATVALGFLVVSVLTWLGKPASMRFVFVGLVILFTAGNVVQLITLVAAPSPSPQTGMDSAEDLSRALTISQLCVTLLIPTYIIWYMNRGPARAFFRGSYLPDPDATPIGER